MHTKLLTIESLAAMLDVSQRTVQREIDACGLLWMTAEWRQGKADAAYKALLEAVGGSGSQGLRESIEAALAAGHEVDAPPGCYWPKE